MKQIPIDACVNVHYEIDKNLFLFIDKDEKLLPTQGKRTNAKL